MSALALGKRGAATALLVHDRAGEGQFMAEGHGIDRRNVMYNNFVIVGPQSDPAGIRGLKSACQALARIAAARAAFVSRGDDSGTNRMERQLWRSANLAPDKNSTWYRALGHGMRSTLSVAAVPIDLKIGDQVLFGKWSGTEVKIDGAELLIMKESDVMGVVDEATAEKKAA